LSQRKSAKLDISSDLDDTQDTEWIKSDDFSRFYDDEDIQNSSGTETGEE
jgi:hypothetical protein